MIIVVATFGQALSGQAAAIHIIGVLVVWRFIMGVGIGGDYPLSAVISSEFASTKIRGRMMTAVFASQGWGNFCQSFLFFPSMPFLPIFASRGPCRLHHYRSLQELYSQRN